jgi:hypothetical protein
MCNLASDANLFQVWRVAAGVNVQGEEQKRLDVIPNIVLKRLPRRYCIGRGRPPRGVAEWSLRLLDNPS